MENRYNKLEGQGTTVNPVKPVQVESVSFRVRKELIDLINRELAKLPYSQTVKAKKVGITQPRLSNLVNNKTDKFSLDALVIIAERLGIVVEFIIAPGKDLK